MENYPLLVEELLGQREACSADAFELAAKDASLRRQISSMWGQDEIRRAKPTPVVEAKNGLVVLETVLWDAVPGFLRRLDAAAEQALRAAGQRSNMVVFVHA